MSPVLLALAAGRGTRFGGSKQTTPVGPSGEWLLDYALFDARRAGFGRAVLVVRPGSEEAWESFRSKLRAGFDVTVVPQVTGLVDPDVESAARSVPWGTAHAVLAAREAIGPSPFAVVNADDFYGTAAYQMAADRAAAATDEALATLVSMRLGATLSPHGPVTRALCRLFGDRVIGLDETRGIERLAGGVPSAGGVELDPDAPVSMNFWVLPPAIFEHLTNRFRIFAGRPDVGSQEFLLPAVIAELIAGGVLAVSSVTAPGPWYGLTHAADLPIVQAGLRELTEAGVYPSRLWA